MNPLQLDALLRVLQEQRNNALNAVAQAQASLEVANAKISELQKQIQELMVNPKVEDAQHPISAV